MKRKTKVIGAVSLTFAMVASLFFGDLAITSNAEEAKGYSYIQDYTLGWNGSIAVYRGGTATQDVATSKIPVYTGKDDNCFGPQTEQAWDAEELLLSQPVQFTTSDGEVHPVESMLSNWNFIADPTAIDNSDVDGKLYVYGTTEGFTYTGNTLTENKYDNQSLTIMSTTDMVNWTDEGRLDSQNLTNEPSYSDDMVKVNWGKKAWAPSGLKHDGDGDGDEEYYIFYTDGGGSVVYLMGDSPVGPWKDVNNGKNMFTQGSPNCAGVVWCFDPAVLRDDKGNAYCYFGGGLPKDPSDPTGKKEIAKDGKTGRVCKLDFVEGTGQVVMDGEPQELDTYYFFEDSEINQFNGKYYYSYCTNWGMGSNEWVGGGVIATYVSSDPMDNICFQPDGDNGEQYTDTKGTEDESDDVYHHFVGEILDNPSALYGQTYNNHHHMQEYKDRYYIFYHSTVLDNSLHRASNQYRCLHVDEIQVDAATDEISITPTYEGASQIEAFDPYKAFDGSQKIINATTSSYSAGVSSTRDDDMVYDTKTGSPMVLDNINTGDWTKIQGVDFGAGATKLTAQVKSSTDEAEIEVFLDDPTKPANKVADMSITNTDGWYSDFTVEFDTPVEDQHDVYFVFRGDGYQVASWTFEAKEIPPTPTPVTPTTAPVVTAAPTVAPVQTVAPTVAPAPVAKPAKAAISSVKSTKKKTATVKFKKVADAKGYQLEYSTSKKFKGAKKVTLKASSKKVVIKKLKSKKKYYVRMRAYNLDGSKKVWGAWSKAKSVKVK